MNLSETEKETIIDFIKNNEPLPKDYIYKLFADEEDVFLFWNGRSEDVTNAVLPFHSIEHIDEPRKEVLGERDGHLGDLFDTKGRQLGGWTNKLIWGDNKLVLSSLVNGPMREEIEKEGGLKLIYIDPPFAVGADFSFNIEINGETAEKKQSVIEEIAYRDTWGKGISSYLAMMYERLKLMHQLLADDGSIYVHCDWRVNSEIHRPIVVKTDTPRIRRIRKMLAELMVASSPNVKLAQDIAARFGINEVRFKMEDNRCILCGLCVRVCHEQMGGKALGFANRGPDKKISAPFAIRSEICLKCGGCDEVCPGKIIPCQGIKIPGELCGKCIKPDDMPFCCPLGTFGCFCENNPLGTDRP